MRLEDLAEEEREIIKTIRTAPCPELMILKSACLLDRLTREELSTDILTENEIQQKNKRLYRIWSSMKQRCNNPKNPAARWYHDKGIRVCEEWENDFFAFQSWALSCGYAEDLTIDRIDPDQDYCPENCRWLTRSENSSRARSHITQSSEHREEHEETYSEYISHKISSLSAVRQSQAAEFIDYLSERETEVGVAIQLLRRLPKPEQKVICDIIFKYDVANRLTRERG